jgi:hypothetical protein
MMSSIVSGRTSAALMREADEPTEASRIACDRNEVAECRLAALAALAALAPTLGV